MRYADVIARERRNALRIVTNPDLFTPSQLLLAWRILRQHGARA